ncbi:MAG TPA: lipid-binding SYLF domain-containing protein [Verrucomicrobiae bacterium]|jgi:lipid-binding SYLF domain-containing protein|nr:lipid-binding SYLF domain-containing protein [Verrucomicrobiae bacterium]
MRTILLSFVLLLTVGPAIALEKPDLDARVLSLTAKFEELQQDPGKRIPADVLRKARAIILLDRTKAGFLFAYQGGSGVAIAKNPRTGKWSPVAFLAANEASLGFQIGAEQNFFAIVLMSDSAPRFLTDPNFEFGGEARGTAGDNSSGAGGTISDTERPVLVYSSRNGLYGGAALKGGSIAPDEAANRIYYGQVLSMSDILFDKKVPRTDAAKHLADKIAFYSKSSKP